MNFCRLSSNSASVAGPLVTSQLARSKKLLIINQCTITNQFNPCIDWYSGGFTFHKMPPMFGNIKNLSRFESYLISFSLLQNTEQDLFITDTTKIACIYCNLHCQGQVYVKLALCCSWGDNSVHVANTSHSKDGSNFNICI